jgi:hypothetical protein
MDESPYPIVLPGPRPTRWIHLGLLAGATAAVLMITFSVNCSGCVQWGLTLGLAGAFLTIVVAVDRIRSGRRPSQLVIDRRGFVNDGRPVPWESVMSIMWVASKGGDAGWPEHIEIRVRSTPEFEAPRDRRVRVIHRDFAIAPNTLIDLLEAAALPRRVRVLAVEPPSPAR